jgi:hypothetical protein
MAKFPLPTRRLLSGVTAKVSTRPKADTGERLISCVRFPYNAEDHSMNKAVLVLVGLFVLTYEVEGWSVVPPKITEEQNLQHRGSSLLLVTKTRSAQPSATRTQ